MKKQDNHRNHASREAWLKAKKMGRLKQVWKGDKSWTKVR